MKYQEPTAEQLWEYIGKACHSIERDDSRENNWKFTWKSGMFMYGPDPRDIVRLAYEHDNKPREYSVHLKFKQAIEFLQTMEPFARGAVMLRDSDETWEEAINRHLGER